MGCSWSSFTLKGSNTAVLLLLLVIYFSSLYIFNLWHVNFHLMFTRSLGILLLPSPGLTMEVSILVCNLFLSSSKIASLSIIWSVPYFVFICVVRFKLCRGSQFCSCWLATTWCFWSWSLSAVSQNCCLISWRASLCSGPGLDIVTFVNVIICWWDKNLWRCLVS